MSKKSDDGVVIWKEIDRSFLPKNMSKDKLATYLKLLIGKVKEDHSMHGYKIDMKDYAVQIVQIMNLAIKNGYVLSNFESEENSENNESHGSSGSEETYRAPSNSNSDDIDWNKIVDD